MRNEKFIRDFFSSFVCFPFNGFLRFKRKIRIVVEIFPEGIGSQKTKKFIQDSKILQSVFPPGTFLIK